MNMQKKEVQKFNTSKNNEKVGIMLWDDVDLLKDAQITAEDALIGIYDFDKYKNKKNNSPVQELIISTSGNIEEVEKAVRKGESVGNAMTFARNLINKSAYVTAKSCIRKVRAVDCYIRTSNRCHRNTTDN